MTRAELFAACPEGRQRRISLLYSNVPESDVRWFQPYWDMGWDLDWKQAHGMEMQMGQNHTANSEDWVPTDPYCKDL